MDGKLMIRIALILALSLGLLMGCQSIGERKQADALQEVLRDYEATIRWGAAAQARDFLAPEQRDAVSVAVPKDLRVTHYEVVQGPTMLDADRAVQTAIVQYVFEDSQVVRELIDRQVWLYDQAAELWHLASPLPEFE